MAERAPNSTEPSAETTSPLQKPVLALPAPPPRDANAPIKLDVGTSEPVSLYDTLGPTIVSSDGTLSRIGNWAEMDEMERSRVLRVLGARNKVRLEGKKAEMEQLDKERNAEQAQ